MIKNQRRNKNSQDSYHDFHDQYFQKTIDGKSTPAPETYVFVLKGEKAKKPK